MQSILKEDIILIKLNTDDDLFKSLEIICKKYSIKNSIILSGIGQLKKIKIGYYKKNYGYLIKKFNSPHELLNLSGNICKNNKKYDFHIHAILSNDKMKNIGGHLFEAKVNITSEIVILNRFLDFKRIIESDSGLKKMIIDNKK